MAFSNAYFVELGLYQCIAQNKIKTIPRQKKKLLNVETFLHQKLAICLFFTSSIKLIDLHFVAFCQGGTITQTHTNTNTQQHTQTLTQTQIKTNTNTQTS